MASIEETISAMAEIEAGNMPPSGKLAYWSAALSIRNRLELNGAYVRVLSRYVGEPLPGRSQLLNELGRNPGKQFPAGLMSLHINLLYEIERLWTAGEIDFDCGSTLASQQAWRENMVARIKGMGCKAVSWALFIYNPYECKLLTIDCWHARRLGIDPRSIAGSGACRKLAYKQAEALLLSECKGLYPDVPPVIVAAMLWENTRQIAGASRGAVFQSHAAISCRWYY